MPVNQGTTTDGDYTLAPKTLTFNEGQTSRNLTFTADQDTLDDDGESVKLTFGNLQTRVSKGSPKEATVNITDDDDPVVSVSFEQASYTVQETDDEDTTDVEEHKVLVEVVLSADPERTVTIELDDVHQGGASDADYTGVPESITFNEGETRKTFTFEAKPDTVDDDDESVLIRFDSPPARVNRGSKPETTISINDDDHPEITIGFEQASYTVDESDDTSTDDTREDTVDVKVVLSADPERQVTVVLDTDHTGGATTQDYSGVPENIIFESGEMEKTIRFQAEHDIIDDDDEKVEINFKDLPDRFTRRTPDTATVAINDDDDPEITVSYGQNTYSVDEGDSVTIHRDPERRPGKDRHHRDRYRKPERGGRRRLLRRPPDPDLQRGEKHRSPSPSMPRTTPWTTMTNTSSSPSRTCPSRVSNGTNRRNDSRDQRRRRPGGHRQFRGGQLHRPRGGLCPSQRDPLGRPGADLNRIHRPGASERRR